MSPTRVASAASLPAALATLFLLVGCSPAPHPADPETPAPPADSAPAAPALADPVFADDAAALAAAEAAYGRYLEVNLASIRGGGYDTDDFALVTTGDALEAAVEGAQSYQDLDAHAVGTISFEIEKLQSHWQEGDVAFVQFTVCESIAELDVQDTDGDSLVRAGRQPYIPYAVTATGQSTDTLIISELTIWERDNFCLG